MANNSASSRSALRIAKTMGVQAEMLPSRTDTGKCWTILDENVERIGFGDGFNQSVEPYRRLSIVQSEFFEKPRKGDIFTISDVDYVIDEPTYDDGVVWHFSVNTR